MGPFKKPTFYLRLGLGLMYLYSGIDLVRHPSAWHWALNPVLVKLPQAAADFVNKTVGLDRFLQIQGGLEIAFALILLAWFLPKKLVTTVVLLTAIELALIMILVGVDLITFRDIGLLGAALALFVILIRR